MAWPLPVVAEAGSARAVVTGIGFEDPCEWIVQWQLGRTETSASMARTQVYTAAGLEETAGLLNLSIYSSRRAPRDGDQVSNLRRMLAASVSAGAVILMAGCLPASSFHTQAAATPELRPEAFFMGVTHGEGTLMQHLKKPRKLHVIGTGSVEPNGDFRLQQDVKYDDGATESRTWHLRRSGPHSYTATLSDASGDVHGETDGNVFHLRYLLRQPAVYMDQLLYLQPDRRTVLNVATVSILGVPWARLSETITRSDSEPAVP